MIKYYNFTENIGSGNLSDTFCQNSDIFQKGGGVLHPSSLVTPLGVSQVYHKDRRETLSNIYDEAFCENSVLANK